VKLGERVRRARRRLGISQSELARLCDMSAPSISNIETGDTKALRGKTLMQFASVLKVTPEWLTSGRDAPEPAEPGLTTQELSLIEHFRKLTTEDRRTITRVVRALRREK
jgi:transcriptional regulator with XRE-family HTH domain